MRNSSKLFGFFTICILLFSSCEKYFGDETDLSFIEIPEQNFREVAYVPVQPILTQFVKPTDVTAGFDELIYVVDNATEEVIALDESGKELGRRFVQGAVAVAQDRSLDLLVIGTIDAVSNPMVKRTCIYRLDLTNGGVYGIRSAQFTDTIIHPFYFKASAISTDAEVRFKDISVLSNNTFYVTRTGPRKTPFRDDAILLFDENDDLITEVNFSDARGGLFPDGFVTKPSGITTLVKPPQINVENREDFIFTSLDPDGVIKVQYITKLESPDGVAYTPKIDFSADTSLASNFINEAFKFDQPVDVEFTGDGTNYIFVLDQGKDSLFQFTSNGLEGVQPPPASGLTKYIKTSFGGSGVGASQFNNPSAVAYKDRILYIADTGNSRLLRFKLTLDIQ